MNEQTRKALEMAREALFAPMNTTKFHQAIAAIDAALSAPASSVAPAGWMKSGALLYRLTDDRKPVNRDEIRVTMADGSRTDEACSRRAGELFDRLASAPAAPVAQGEPEGELMSVNQWIELAVRHVNADWNSRYLSVVKALVTDACAVIALRPAPAALVAQPLTDEQWLKLWTHKTGQRIKPGDKRAELLTTLRFAERAHGIGQVGAA